MEEREADRVELVTTGSPTSAAALRAIALALFEAGYDGRDPDAMHYLADDLRAWRLLRMAAKRRADRRGAWWTILWTALATGVVGVLIQWLTTLLGHGHSGAQPPGNGD